MHCLLLGDIFYIIPVLFVDINIPLPLKVIVNLKCLNFKCNFLHIAHRLKSKTCLYLPEWHRQKQWRKCLVKKLINSKLINN